MTRRLPVWILVMAGVVGASPAFAQTGQTPPPPAAEPKATATTTVSGDTGLWFVPTGEVLRARKWSFSFGRTNMDDGQGFSDISTFPLTIGVGLGNRAEIFGSWTLVTRIDRDSRPLFFESTPAALASGTGGGLLLNYPLDRKTFMASGPGDAWIGGKINLLSQADNKPLEFAVRAMVKLPSGSKADGASTGKADFQIDGILSHDAKIVELTGFAGFIARGNPAGYTLTNGVRWGVGAAFPARLPVRITTELFGERYSHSTITAPAGQFGVDGSAVPVSTSLKSPVNLDLGLTLQMPQGFFVGGGVLWNVHMAGRGEAKCFAGIACPSFSNTPKDRMGIEVHLGYHPGSRGAASRDFMADEARRAAAGGGAGAGAGGLGGRAGGGGVGPGGAGGGAAGGGVGPAGRGAGAGAAGAGGAGGGAAGAGAAGAGAAGAGGGAAGGGAAGAGGAGAAGAGGGAAVGAGAGAAGAGGVGGGGAGGGAGGAAGAGAAGAGGGAAGAGGAGGARPNRPATVHAGCDPCTVEVGKTLTVSADAQDPDGDPLTYRWSAPSGTLASPTNRQTQWTAPMQPGPVAIAVVVDDGRGGTTRDTVTVQVVAPDTRALAFEDVHFDFDRSTLRDNDLPTLDKVVAAMKADASIQLQIEGNTCNIGTNEYNLALGERRARAVRDYLVAHGVAADRLSTVSYGEDKPKYDNTEIEGRRLNRRTAMVVRMR